jgi:hypothetical protein
MIILALVALVLVVVDVFAALPAVVKRVWSPVTTTAIVVLFLLLLNRLLALPVPTLRF